MREMPRAAGGFATEVATEGAAACTGGVTTGTGTAGTAGATSAEGVAGGVAGIVVCALPGTAGFDSKACEDAFASAGLRHMKDSSPSISPGTLGRAAGVSKTCSNYSTGVASCKSRLQRFFPTEHGRMGLELKPPRPCVHRYSEVPSEPRCNLRVRKKRSLPPRGCATNCWDRKLGPGPRPRKAQSREPRHARR